MYNTGVSLSSGLPINMANARFKTGLFQVTKGNDIVGIKETLKLKEIKLA
jgi:hypothetical protein